MVRRVSTREAALYFGFWGVVVQPHMIFIFWARSILHVFSYFHWVPPDLFYPTATLPLP